MPDHIPALDALLIGTVLIVSEMTTAGAAYYSWQMIGIVALAIGLYSMRTAQETRSIDSDDVSEATVMRQTLIPITESTDFKSDRNSIIL